MKKFLLSSFILIFIGTFALGQITIPMEKKGDVYYVPGEINGVPLKFIFDTGASNVHISLTEALFMLKNEYLEDSDFGNTSYSQIANGDIVENTEVLLREVKVGPISIYNVKAMISNTIEAPLLLGQSAIQKLGPIQLNGNKLIVSNGKDSQPEENALFFYQKAYQLSESAHYDEAIKYATDALKSTIDHDLKSAIYITLGHAYKSKGDINLAIEALNNALTENPLNEIALYNIGVCLYENNNVIEALNYLNRIVDRTNYIKNKALLSNSYYYKGNCHTKFKESMDAENAYKTSLEIEPNLYAALSLGNLYFDAKRFNEAIPLYQNIVSSEPMKLSSLEVWHKLGYCYMQIDKFREALDAFHNCMGNAIENTNLIFAYPWDEQDAFKYKHLPLDAELWIARLSNDPNLSIKYYEELSRLLGDTNNFTPQDYLTWANAIEVAYNPALRNNKIYEVLGLGLEKFSDNPDILFYYSNLTEVDDSLKLKYLYKIIEQEFNYSPTTFDYSTIYNNIAWLLHLNNKSAEGLPYAESAVNKGPNHDYNWETLGEIYYTLGRFQDCINAMSKCIELNESASESAYEFRARSYKKLGKKKEAQKDMEQIKQL